MKQEKRKRCTYEVPTLTVVSFAAERGFAGSTVTMVGYGNTRETDNTPEDRTREGGYLFQ